MAFAEEVQKGVGLISDVLTQGAEVYQTIMGPIKVPTPTTVPVTESVAGGAEVTADDVKPPDNTALYVVGGLVLLVLLSR